MPMQKVWWKGCSAPFCGWPPPPGQEAAVNAAFHILWPWPSGQVWYCILLLSRQCCGGLFLFIYLHKETGIIMAR